MTDRRANLGRLLRPRHIAFVGGSQAEGPIQATLRAGYEGQIWAVNPRKSELAGIPTVPSVDDLPEAPDATLLAMSPERSIEALTALSAMGAGGASAVGGGYAEIGDEGETLQARLIAAAGDMAVVGPNCMGVMNQFEGAAVWATDNHMHRVSAPATAIISQSGAFVYGITNIEETVPLGYAISVGNQAVVDAADCIHAVLDDERVRSIGLYLEGVPDGNALGDACLRAADLGVPIVVLKGAQTKFGQEIAISHTASMVVDADLWDAFTDRYGIVGASTPKALLETLKFLAVSGVPRGNRLTAITYSGGLNGLIAARCEEMGVELSQPTAERKQGLLDRMPIGVPVRNPLDLNLPFSSSTGIDMTDREASTAAIVDLAAEVADELAFFVDIPREDGSGLGDEWAHGIHATIAAAAELEIPTAVSCILPEGLPNSIQHTLLDAGVTPLLGFAEAMEALGTAVAVGEIHRAFAGRGRPGDLVGIGSERAPVRIRNEAASKQLLREAGVTTPDSWSGPADEAVSAAAAVGFPVAVKVLSTTITHKAAAGGVKLGLGSKAAVADAVAEMRAALPDLSEVLVERMIDDPAGEVIVGVTHNASVGLALLVGSGGTSVEHMANYRTLLLPLEDHQLDRALTELSLTDDTAALRQTIKAVESTALSLADTLASMEINPVILTESGGAIAADALIVTTR